MANILDKERETLILESILNNVNCLLSYNSSEYIVLIKKQKNKEYCTLFLTDCSDHFWIEKLDIAFCEKLKVEMNVKTKTETFAKHFVQAFSNQPKIQIQESEAKLKLQLKISDGLIINCPVRFNICISCDESKEEFKLLTRSFFKQLYEAKEQQISNLKNEIERQKEEKIQKGQNEQKNFFKTVMSIPEKKQAPGSIKNRDLINPQRKKRKNEGLKFVGCD